MTRAAETLTEQFGMSDPTLWRLPVRTTKFRNLSASKSEEIPMVDRGSMNFVVALDEGLSGSKIVNPPGNSGHFSVDEFAQLRASGDEPERLTDQLSLYKNFEYKPLPITREQVEQVAEERDVLRSVSDSSQLQDTELEDEQQSIFDSQLSSVARPVSPDYFPVSFERFPAELR
jgi:hypothetical protein